MQLKPREAVHLGLVLHELGTNARKYGALKVPEGRLRVTWHLTGHGARHYLEINWVESGGDSQSPAVHGFGTVLIEAEAFAVRRAHELCANGRQRYALAPPEIGDSAGLMDVLMISGRISVEDDTCRATDRGPPGGAGSAVVRDVRPKAGGSTSSASIASGAGRG
jgi:hypothetical protein